MSRTYDTDVVWPSRAVVTAGMPYGNKPLHFGHIGGVFIPADAFARFLRDRIGKENVRFVSGTDCYGSPINEGYRKAVEAGEFAGTIDEYVMGNHIRQKETLDAFDVSLDIFEGSGLGRCKDVHQSLSEKLIEGLYEQGYLHLEETLQFFDAEANTYLNGRQVVGRCPVQGCKSEHGYADECDMGHQYDPADLINPVSSITGTVPEMRPVKNWYFNLPAFSGFLKEHVALLQSDPETRPVIPQTIDEFLAPPVIFVKNEFYDEYLLLADSLPPHTFREAEKGKQSFEIQFESISDRDVAKAALTEAQIRFRTSKTLVPFRITGSIDWGVKAPVLDGVEGLTVWCWPESLWAPISFTIALNDELALPRNTWRDFWCADDAQVYQFIGQDNIYFYGVAQPAMWEALGKRGVFGGPDAKPLRQTTLVANHHVLFGKTKASSSGAVKPPTGEELLEHYTAEQLRAHFLALGLGQKSVGFKPKPFDPALTDEQREDKRVADPVLKEGTLLTNVFNRLARSCLYEAQKSFNGNMPLGAVSVDVVDKAHEALGRYEHLMHSFELHSVMQLADEFIRYANKYWADNIKLAAEEEEAGSPNALAHRRQVLLDSFYLLRICTLMMHPIVPKGCEVICDYMDFEPEAFFSWNYDFNDMDELCHAHEIDAGAHAVCELPPRFDFFRKHESQY
ncbi:MAG: class I tRNA ligase family protein [Eggerthellaceae bacterium]|nr:class I tRNA ligase family protein [Eggerthellaceae bacterium]